MARCAFRGQHKPRRDLFRGLHLEQLRSFLRFQNVAALIQREFGVDLGVLMLDHPLHSGGAFLLVRLREQDQVPAELDVAALDLDHDREFGRQQRFIVLSAAPVDESVARLGAERVRSPLAAIRRNDVAVSHQQQRPAFPVAAQPRDEIQPPRIAAQQLA